MAAGGRLLLILIIFFSFTIAIVALLQGTAATDYIVGDDLGWTVPPNISYYNDWAANKTFKEEDYLKFVSNGSNNFAIVTKQEYDNCTKEVQSNIVFIPNMSIGLSHPDSGMYHFICTIDSHCEAGQKLAVNVTSSATDGFSSVSLLPTFGTLLSVSYAAYLLFN